MIQVTSGRAWIDLTDGTHFVSGCYANLDMNPEIRLGTIKVQCAKIDGTGGSKIGPRNWRMI